MANGPRLISFQVFLGIALNLASAALLAAAPEPFHNGSAGNCEGCHLQRSGSETDNGGAKLTLRGSDASSTCLLCHEAPETVNSPQDHYVATSSSLLTPGVPPNQLTPGGDFGWLKKNYCWQESDNLSGRTETCSFGERHGHNIVARDFGYTADKRNIVAPGGTFRGENLSCTSCHDPHGNYKRFPEGVRFAPDTAAAGSGSYTNSPSPTSLSPVGTYRLLAGKGYRPKGSDREFKYDPPAAVTPPAYNRRESFTDTRVAYGLGMSEWCRNCHSSVHDSSAPRNRQHPSGEGAHLPQNVVMNYNAYVSSGNLNGTPATAYSSLVPFELGTDNYAELKLIANSNGANRNGPTGEGRVICLTCHRAHASGWDSSTRWNAASPFIVANGSYPGADDFTSAKYAQGRSVREIQKTFYGRPATRFAEYQRSLCNKCHSQD